MADTPHDYWCRVPALEALNISEAQRRNWSVPMDELTGRLSQCTRYAVDWAVLLNESGAEAMPGRQFGEDDMEWPRPNASWPVEMCRDGWVYNRSEVSSSIVIDVSRGFSRAYVVQLNY